MNIKKCIIVLLFLFTGISVFAQSDWHFETKIERNNHYLLEGAIANRYPITMYLERDGFCLYEYRGNVIYRLKGWYYYNNRKIKLPLIGSEIIAYSDRFDTSKVTLYVPTDIFDNIRDNSCDLKDFKEIFVTEEKQGRMSDFESMQWRMSNNESFLSVQLREIQRPSQETRVSILLNIRGIEMLYFDLTDNLRDLKDPWGEPCGIYVEQLNIEASKKINNEFYLIFSFSLPSRPGSYGMGHCGAGYEDYLGFLHISSFEVKEFTYYQIDSCSYLIEEKYTFDENAPEKGITVNPSSI
jgi:hypothetical protein